MEAKNVDMLAPLDTLSIDVLNHGYVRLVDVMPRIMKEGETCDLAVVDKARASYQLGTFRKSTDRGLINNLMRHKHTSPFEGVKFKFEIRLPIFIMRQLIRHRTASVNEESGRYSKLRPQYYVPSEVRRQSKTNKQSSDVEEGFDPTIQTPSGTPNAPVYRSTTNTIDVISSSNYDAYEQMLDQGVAREQARMVLPVNYYTTCVWTMDLHNLLHFLRLRLADDAQYEIRVYAEAIAHFVKQLCPWTWDAYERYVLNSLTLSGPDLELLKMVKLETQTHYVFGSPEPVKSLKRVELDYDQDVKGIMSKGEYREFLAKLERLL